MSCIKDDLVQKYIDGEVSPEELASIKEHLSGCSACALQIEARERLAKNIKSTIHLLDEAEVNIPAFIVPEHNKPKKRTIINKYFLAVSAASILILVLFLLNKDGQHADSDLIFVNSFESEFDANRTISQQEMVINIIDANGKVSEFHIE